MEKGVVGVTMINLNCLPPPQRATRNAQRATRNAQRGLRQRNNRIIIRLKSNICSV
jgi:hypothetical protein